MISSDGLEAANVRREMEEDWLAWGPAEFEEAVADGSHQADPDFEGGAGKKSAPVPATRALD